jgi:hypothetical protein
MRITDSIIIPKSFSPETEKDKCNNYKPNACNGWGQ